MWFRSRFAPIVLAAALPACSTTESDRQTPETDVPALTFEKYTLPNGLEVILSEDHRLPLVAVNLWYHVGPVNEEPGRTGFAHLFEHMMFQGSKHAPGDSHFKLLESAGASDVNGTTDFDRTNYFETVPAEQLELALWLEADRMGYLIEEIDQAKLSNQQDVVRNERRQSYENQPFGIVEEAVYHLLFPKGHPYHASVIGSHADIQAANLADVRNFLKLYYTPNNASLAIVGDFDPAATKRLVEKYFGPLKRGEDVPHPTVQTPRISAERRAVVHDRVELPRVYMAWITSPIFTAGDADADIAASVLGGGRSSRLFKSLVYDQQIAQTVTVSQYSLTLGSVFQITAAARPGHTPEEIEKAIDAELARFRKEGPDQSEIDRARNTIETRIVQGLERLGGFGGVADRLNLYNHHIGDPGYLDEDVRRYREVTPASVQRFAQQQLQSTARVVVYGVPGEPNLGPVVPSSTVVSNDSAPVESINADEPWRAQLPSAGSARSMVVPVPVSFTLRNGLTVLVNERPDLPIVSASLVVATGSGANPIDRPGLANFTAAMLDEGTPSRSALEIADDVAQLGATLGTSSSMDFTQVTMTSLKRTFPSVLEIAADIVRHAAFPEEEIERQRASRLATLVQQRASAGAAANTAMAASLYGDRHPYGFTELGTEASNRAITAADMREFWRKYFVPNNTALVVSGAVSADELRDDVERILGDWSPAPLDVPVIGTPSTTLARVVLVDRPGAPQTQLLVGWIGVPRTTPDYEALLVMNEALGGMFSSRLNLNLREQHGYAYGAGSLLAFRRGPGPFYVSTSVRTDATAPAVTEILRELRGLRERPLSKDELTSAKGSLIRSLPSLFETSGRVTSSTANTFVYGLGPDYYRKYQARLAAVDAAHVQAAIERYLDPENVVVIAVGDRVRISEPLRRLGLGPIELRGPDGRVRSSP